MRWKTPIHLLIACALGFLVSMLVYRREEPAAVVEEVRVEEARSETADSTDDASMRAAYEKRISELTRELEALRASSNLNSTAPEPISRGRTGDEAADFVQATLDAGAGGRKIVRDRETNQLLAAGFSTERIGWIRKRSEELRVAIERRAYEGKSGPMAMAYAIDPDLDLKDEIGESEYDRYRQALGRSAGLRIERVLPTSNAESAGMKPGDQVVGYGGKRVYNEPMLNSMIAANGAGSTVTLEVLRDGKNIFVTVPSGPLGVQAEDQVQIALRNRISSRSWDP